MSDEQGSRTTKPSARYTSYAQKPAAAAALYESAKALKLAYYRSRYPDWSEEQLKKAVNDWMLKRPS